MRDLHGFLEQLREVIEDGAHGGYPQFEEVNERYAEVAARRLA